MSIRAILEDPGYYALKHYILDHTGLGYYADKDEDLAARLARRLTARGVRTCAAYRHALQDPQTGPAEHDSLVGELTIGETYFFRQPEHFDLLRETVLPEILERNKNERRLRIWSAGCATGAEPYSLSLLLRLEFATRLEGWDVSILATDINPDFLEQARRGRFGPWALRELPEAVKNCCFIPEGKGWLLRPEYRNQVSFQYHNLAVDSPFPGEDGFPLDIILCRNVLIYFSSAGIRRVVNRFHDSLASGGWLLVGHSEPNAETFQKFEVIWDSKVTAYRRPLNVGPFPPPIEFGAAFSMPGFDAPLEPVPVSPVKEPGSPRVPLPIPAAGKDGGTVEQARALADRGEWQQAAEYCHRAIASDALNASAHFTLGLILEHQGDVAAAERTLRNAIYLDRGFAYAHYHLGRLLGGTHATQARRAFRNVLTLLSDTPNEEPVKNGDGITAAELKDLTLMHLEVLDKP